MHTWNVKLFAVIIEALQMNFAFLNTNLSWKLMYETHRKPLSKLKLQFSVSSAVCMNKNVLFFFFYLFHYIGFPSYIVLTQTFGALCSVPSTESYLA